MSELKLTVLSLRYSSWSMRPWLALTHAGASFTTETVALSSFAAPMSERRALGSVAGLFPILHVDNVPIHESLAIAEYLAEAFPDAGLWPTARLDRARARASCAEMVSSFASLRNTMSCHLFARVPTFVPDEGTARDIARVFEIWTQCLDNSGGPFLFGAVSNADFFYFPVLSRLRTYGIDIPNALRDYAATLEDLPAVHALVATAHVAPANAVYDEYVTGLGGDPEAALD